MSKFDTDASEKCFLGVEKCLAVCYNKVYKYVIMYRMLYSVQKGASDGEKTGQIPGAGRCTR